MYSHCEHRCHSLARRCPYRIEGDCNATKSIVSELTPTIATTLDLKGTPVPKSNSHHDHNILRVAAMGDGSTKNKDVVVWVQLSLRQLNRLHDASYVHAAKVLHELLGDLYAPEVDACSGKNSWLCHSSFTYTCQGAHTLSQRKLHAFEASTQTESDNTQGGA